MSLKDTPPKKAAVICCKKNAKMTVETVETVVAAAPYAALIGHKLRPLLSDSQSAAADYEEDVIQICHLLSRNGKLSLVRLTKSFPTIPNLRGIANANQNDERFKMWSVMLLCTIQIFVQYLFSYFRLETGSYVLIFVLSRVCEENDVEIQWLQSKKKFSYDIKCRTFSKVRNVRK